MFFAQMFCYGSDLAGVGITGIQGCIGAVYNGNNRLYAVHIPPMSPESNKKGADDFAGYVAQHENAGGQAGTLTVFVNGTNRASATAETRYMKGLLAPQSTLLVRIMTGLGQGTGEQVNAQSPSILVTRRGDLLYKHVPEDNYVAGVGGFFGGQYLGQPGGMDSSKVPSNLHSEDTWTTIGAQNSYRVHIH